MILFPSNYQDTKDDLKLFISGHLPFINERFLEPLKTVFYA